MARTLLIVVVLLSLGWSCLAVLHPPTVSVYTTKPLIEGKPNTFVCLVRGFHPPEISVELLKNGVVLQNVEALDMSFDPDWNYQWMKYITFTHESDDEFGCKVKHAKSDHKVYNWEPMR